MEPQKFIQCPLCKERSFIKLKKDYDGFKVISKKKTCALCGYEFKEDEEIPYIKEKQLFKDESEDKNFCRDCQYYVTHPWTQKCTLTNQETTALDTCPEFAPREEEIN